MSARHSSRPNEPDASGARPAPLGWRLVVLLFILAALVFLREPVHFSLELQRQLEADAPDQEYVVDAVDLPWKQFRRVVEEFWASGKIAHRQEAIQLLSVRALIYPEADLSAYQGMLGEAMNDVDSTVRDLSVPLAVRLNPRQAMPQLLAQLKDPDHQTRIAAMGHLRRLGATNALPYVAGQLRENDPLLVYEAVSWMQRLTGVDHGLGAVRNARRRLSMVARVDVGFEGFHRAWQSAMEWWALQPVVELPEPLVTPPLAAQPLAVPVERFGLIGADQQPFECRAIENRPVLLYFFTSWDTYGAPEIKRFHRLAAGRMPMLGIALDAIPDKHNLSRLSVDMGRPLPARYDGTSPFALEEIIAFVNHRLDRYAIRFPVAYDVEGRLTRLLQGGEIPAYVFLDAEHRLVRRLSGTRRAESLMDVAAHYGLQDATPRDDRKGGADGLLLGLAGAGAE